MSASVRINETSVWVAATWIFDNALQDIAIVVDERDPQLAEVIRGGTTDQHAFGYLDLTSWSPEAVRRFLNSAVQAFSRRESLGATSFHEPKFFAVYMRLFEELIAVLRRDPRAFDGGVGGQRAAAEVRPPS